MYYPLQQIQKEIKQTRRYKTTIQRKDKSVCYWWTTVYTSSNHTAVERFSRAKIRRYFLKLRIVQQNCHFSSLWQIVDSRVGPVQRRSPLGPSTCDTRAVIRHKRHFNAHGITRLTTISSSPMGLQLEHLSPPMVALLSRNGLSMKVFIRHEGRESCNQWHRVL